MEHAILFLVLALTVKFRNNKKNQYKKTPIEVKLKI